jgi:Ser/Thr protein kinase RdoA (MazF antagonist)
VDHVLEIAEELFGIRATASQLPSERDQNFLLTENGGEEFVMKIANALEARDFLEAQNFVLKHLAERVTFCQQLVRAASGGEIVSVKAATGQTHLVRLVRYLPGVPLAEIEPHSPCLRRDLGRKLGQLAQALADFDHPAVHRDFHWDLSSGRRILGEFALLIKDDGLRSLVLQYRFDFDVNLRRSVIHGDANDYNVLVDPDSMTVAGLLDFGDMVYSYTAGDLAIAIAYVVLEEANPLEAADEVVDGYTSEFALLDNEREALWSLVLLRLCMSVCLAAYQSQQQPDNEYLSISQRAIAGNLPRLFAARGLRG